MLEYESILFDEIPGTRLFSSVRADGTVFVRENNFRGDVMLSCMHHVRPEDVEQAKAKCWHAVRDMIYGGE